MKTKKAEATKNSIIKAATDLFMVTDVSKVTINEIVKKAGVAKGTFYLYFESKDDIVWEFIEEQTGQANGWFKTFETRGYSDDDIKEIANFAVTFTKKHLKVLKVMHNARFYNFLGVKKMEEHYFSYWISPIYVWVEKGKILGKLNVKNSKLTAYYLVTSIHEMLDRCIIGELDVSLDDLQEFLEDLLIKMLIHRK